MVTRYVDVSIGVIVSNSEQVLMVHRMGVMGRPVVVMPWVLFLVIVLVFAIVICFVSCPVVIVVGCWSCSRRVLVLFFFIAVYSVV